ncbi:GerAB/ArcD/ProY family transporter [Paenibacillus riograndensis]|uniref:Spore germination protein n=1 Tax=Paenibacillus riograndensis SBR5 TaxID=1073571 RepID=A0A0E4CVE6_9BACL|nr:endospore germination permease [Paenibacillus riograndensis]CQR54087.1 spore germination protein [Paenibacillus riograndensis SBR5]
MIEKGKISAAQLGLLFYSVTAYDGILYIPKVTGKEAGHDLWLSPIWAHLLGLLFVLGMLRLSSRFPKETIIQYSVRLLGPWAGKAVGLVVILYGINLTSVILREFGDFISAVFLRETPPLIAIGGIVLLVAYAVRGGLEVLGRLAELFLPITFLVFGLLIILSIPEWDVNNILPVMGEGIAPSIKGALVPFSWFSGYLMLGLYFPFVSNQKKTTVCIVLTWFALMVTLSVSGLVSVFLFGKHVSTLNYPFIEVVRYIGIGKFIQHVDALLLIVWLPGTFIQLTTYLYTAALGASQWFGLKNYRQLVFPVGFIALVLSMWRTSGVEEFQIYLGTSHVIFDFFNIALGLLLFLTAWIRSRKGRRQAVAESNPAK